jgi:hypothetical protein
MCSCLRCGAVAQLGERLVRNEEVSGSIPLSSTKMTWYASNVIPEVAGVMGFTRTAASLMDADDNSSQELPAEEFLCLGDLYDVHNDPREA